MKILDGKKVSEKIFSQLKEDVGKLSKTPRLEIFLVGNDFGSKKYVEMKKKRGEEIGVIVNVNSFNTEADSEEIIEKISEFNMDPDVTGIMVQLPLPHGLSEKEILEAIDPAKDVDGLTATNLGLLFQRNPYAIASATPLGIMLLLDEYDINLEGKNVVIINDTKVVGLPLSAMMLTRRATVTVCHDRTEDLEDITSKADILVSAVGKAKFVTDDMVKEGAVVIDVGISMGEDGKIAGDVDFEEVKEKASYIAPVPGGVGPMTVASLFRNLILSAQSE